MTMPEATPMPNETAKIGSQNFDRRRNTGVRVKKYAPSRTAIYEARPTVNAGSKMCSAMTHANCSRDNSSASSMAHPHGEVAIVPHVGPPLCAVQDRLGGAVGISISDFSLEMRP